MVCCVVKKKNVDLAFEVSVCKEQNWKKKSLIKLLVFLLWLELLWKI
jgi:hypothetical protein